MKQFKHPDRRNWEDIPVGTIVHGSKHNSGNHTEKIKGIDICHLSCPYCRSNKMGWRLDLSGFNCIFASNGKSFWEEVDDLDE